ncbi:transglutaminase superfamily protein [Pseudonocardia hierapolitana]|uniref:Transglutaminase superfamily protein n=1 Tax=Pseudonocardia hierapolitana TaxID=1128676 RepID=A0A561SYU2_9PSEU|nr:transglutaminase domain-containing protein [Pseudonocardia hierapolitana]TWF80030.1 transglutaminase superfamily protein [Pseudonocardia hierapolitana]
MADEPRLNEDFPIRESLSPPVIRRPVVECAEALALSGFVPHAVVRVFTDVGELLGEENPPFGFTDVPLRRPVALGERLVATQTVANVDSGPSSPPVVVGALPEGQIRDRAPRVADGLVECGRVVPVSDLVPGCRVHVEENGIEVGTAVAASDRVPVVTAALHAGGVVTARQVACEGTGHEIAGSSSAPVTVTAAPVPAPSPVVDTASLVVGNDAVTLRGLLIGAGVEVTDSGATVSSGWLATAAANFFPVTPPLTGGPVSGTQELCGNVSPPAPPERPEKTLRAPMVLGPICAGARFVVVRDTVINAVVVVLRNGVPAAYGGAAPGDVALQLGGGASLSSGDTITAVQYLGPIVSPVSAPVVVVSRLRAPSVEILGGNPFFTAKPGEQAIEGPVFPRGVGEGPVIAVQSCCTDGLPRVRILGPDGDIVAEPEVVEVFPGYATTRWTWPQPANAVRVGRYTVVAESACTEQAAEVPFFVIFDPATIGGPARFSFDPTAVWFGARTNAVAGLHYYLHPSDVRIFGPALAAVSGGTDSFSAAVRVARTEEALLAYSLNYHTQDTIDLITNFSEAQCADDACLLVAMLRAIGIPAHPVTADAGLETGAANWTFDTWVEFLAPDGGGAVEWRILHPHEYPGMQPESRRTFGTTRGVAVKSFNDVIVMAGETWAAAALDDGSSDVTYGRNDCGEPQQQVTRAAWVDELCEQGYWPDPHWDCTGVRSRGLAAGAGVRFAGGPPDFGGTLEGTLEVGNTGPDREFGTFVVELVGSRAESKAPADTVYATTELRVALDPAGTVTVPFRFDLPPTLPPAERLLLRGRLDGRIAVEREVRLTPRVEGSVDWPHRHVLGEASTLRIRVVNPTDAVARDVVVRLDPLHAVAAERVVWTLGDLGPREEREITTGVTTVAGLDSGSVHVSLASAEGGGGILRHPIRIEAPEAPTDAGPGAIAR